MGEFKIDADQIRRALVTALEFADKDTRTSRPPLHSVHVEPAGDGTVDVVATDCYVLSVETVEADGDLFGFTIPYAVSKDLVKMIPAPKKSVVSSGTVTFTADDTGVTVRFVGAGEASTKFRTMESDGHTFPNCGYLFASVEKAELEPVDQAVFPPNILGRAVTAMVKRDPMEPIRFQFRGPVPKPVLVTQGDTFRALVMRTPAA